MKAIIIEDELPASRRLSKLISETDPSIEIEKILDSVESSVEWFKQHPEPRLLFMDIHLSDGSSFEIFKKVNVQGPVIFTTAYNEYAIDAFKVNSIDYLLKPIKKQDLEAALFKLKNLHPNFTQEQLDNVSSEHTTKYKERFVIKFGNKIKTLTADEIAYFYSKDKLSFICDTEGRNYPFDMSLDKIESLLNPDIFFRVNRQILAHAKSIVDIQTSIKSRIILTLQPATTIESIISSERSSLFKKWLKKE